MATLGKFTRGDIARFFKFPSVQLSIAGIGDVKSLCRDGSDEESRNDAGEDDIEESQTTSKKCWSLTFVDTWAKWLESLDQASVHQQFHNLLFSTCASENSKELNNSHHFFFSKKQFIFELLNF